MNELELLRVNFWTDMVKVYLQESYLNPKLSLAVDYADAALDHFDERFNNGKSKN